MSVFSFHVRKAQLGDYEFHLEEGDRRPLSIRVLLFPSEREHYLVPSTAYNALSEWYANRPRGEWLFAEHDYETQLLKSLRRKVKAAIDQIRWLRARVDKLEHELRLYRPRVLEHSSRAFSQFVSGRTRMLEVD